MNVLDANDRGGLLRAAPTRTMPAPDGTNSNLPAAANKTACFAPKAVGHTTAAHAVVLVSHRCAPLPPRQLPR